MIGMNAVQCLCAIGEIGTSKEKASGTGKRDAIILMGASIKVNTNKQKCQPKQTH